MRRRAIRRRVGESLAKLLDRKKEPIDEDPKPEPMSGKLSHEKPASRQAIFYQPHRAKEVKFRDTRGDVMEVQPSGALRAVTKPLSREKRKRLVRTAMTQVSKKKKETDQKGKAPK